MNVYLESAKPARLAKVRCRIVREENPQQPWDWMDMVFKQNVIEDGQEKKWPDDTVWHFTVWFDGSKTYWYTTKERLLQFFDSDLSHHTHEALKKLEEEEKKILKQYCDGEVFGIIREEWDESNREWKHVDSLFGMYGAESVADCMNDIVKDGDVICCDEEVKYNFDIITTDEK